MNDQHDLKTHWEATEGPAGRLNLRPFAKLVRRLASRPGHKFRLSMVFDRLGVMCRAQALQSLAAVLCLALGLSGLAAPAFAQAVTPGSATQLKLQFQGQTRTYIIYVPRSLKTITAARPAVLLLHGNGGSGVAIMGASRLNALAESEGFVAIYPETQGGRAWNDGRASKAGYDDLGYILKVIEASALYNGVNTDKVFVGGASSGGFMAQRLACEASTSFQAVSVGSALLTTALSARCAPSRDLPMVFIDGTADTIVPFAGANWVLSQPDTRDFWKAEAECTRTSGLIAQPDRYDDGTTLSLERIDRCARGDLVLDFYVIESGGHTWPGITGKVSPVQNGLTSQEINATSTMVEFFVRYGL